MKYMKKEVKYIENIDNTKFTYITPTNIMTTNKTITKKMDHKLNI